MANLEVSSVLAEISASIDGEAAVSSIVIEIASIIPNGEAAVASCAMEVAFSFEPPPTANNALQSEFVRQQSFIQSHSLKTRMGQKSNF